MGKLRGSRGEKNILSSKFLTNENRSIVLISVLQKITLPTLSRYQHLSETPLLKVFAAYFQKYHHFFKNI
jgi:hypothetical protein